LGEEEAEVESQEEKARWAEGFRRHEAIRALLERHKGLLSNSDVRDVAWELGVSQATTYRLIAAYKMTGTVEALMPKAIGRPKGLRLVDKRVETILTRAIREVYLTPNKPTLKHLVDQVHSRCAEADLQLPDRKTIRARVDAIPARVRALRRGDLKAIKATTPVPGQFVATRPLEIVQIDHTEIDIIVVDEENRKPLPPRPWLTLAIDVFSRMVTGFHVSLSQPSRVSVGLCLLRSVFDKTAWLRDREITAEWPVAGLPESVHVDNAAEFKSRAFRRACENEGIAVTYRPPARPRYGGHIERLIGTMMGAVHVLPGTTFRNADSRGDYNPTSAACMTLHELETYLAVEITESYHQRIHRGLQRPPIAVWRDFVDDVPLRMPKDRMGFWVSFLPEEKRILRPDGIHMFGSLKYWNGALARDVGRAGDGVLVKYDPRDISRVFVARPSGRYVEARWSDLTWPPVSLHEWNNQQRELNKLARAERNTGAVLRATVRKRSIVEKAKRLTLEAERMSSLSPINKRRDDDFGWLRGVDSSIPIPGED
jgi:putative transposase